MTSPKDQPAAEISRFVLKDCELIAIATHKRANTLKELRDQIETLSLDSLYYHFWANLLLPHFEEREYVNDFASWVRHSLFDAKLAEQLAVLDPDSLNDMEELRYRLLECIDDRLEESEYLRWFQAAQPFEFLRSQIVVFDTRVRINAPPELTTLIPRISVSSVFYHFIDARRRTPDKIDDLRQWLALFGDTYQPLIDHLGSIDPYFGTLVELRRQVAATFQNYFAEHAS
ncbi:MAG: DUF5752 family protein [Gammaproteobacteria bacterium]